MNRATRVLAKNVAFAAIFILIVVTLLNRPMPGSVEVTRPSSMEVQSAPVSIFGAQESVQSGEKYNLSSVKIHSLWIGDQTKLKKDKITKWSKDHQLIIHTEEDEILEGLPALWKKANSLAVPLIVRTDYLKFLMLYKYGDVVCDIDTAPAKPVFEWNVDDDCEVYFGLEFRRKDYKGPVRRPSRRGAKEYVRPFQFSTWSFLAKRPGNKIVESFIEIATMHIMGRQDIDDSAVQEVSGSGLLSDFIAYLFEKEGRDFVAEMKAIPTDGTLKINGVCITERGFNGAWIRHGFMNSWRQET